MEKKAYTLVFKGMVALDRVIFPKGTSGFVLDVLARQFLWTEGLDYRHGTGHGVGSFLVPAFVVAFWFDADLTDTRMFTKVPSELAPDFSTPKFRSRPAW
jgi:hypothetical protein